MGAEDKRQEPRVDVCSVVLPFLGTRVEDHQPFQYLLQDVSPGGIRIALPRWVASRECLKIGDVIDFHVPFRMGAHILSIGTVSWQRWDAEYEAQILGASLTRRAPAFYPVHLEVETRDVTLNLTDFRSADDMLVKVVKDAAFLKRGLLIYLGHLEAFFSRVGGLSAEEYGEFQEQILEDVRAKVRRNAVWLDDLLERVRGGLGVGGLDLEELRAVMEPEIYLDIFRFALGSQTTRLYMAAMKELEKKTYSAYNAIVMLYISALGGASSCAMSAH